MDWLEHTRAALLRRKGQWPAIAKATGLSYSWLCKFGQNTLKSPGIVYVQTLATYFEAHPASHDHAPLITTPPTAK